MSRSNRISILGVLVVACVIGVGVAWLNRPTERGNSRIMPPRWATSLATSSALKVNVVGYDSGIIAAYRLSDNSLLWEIKPHSEPVFSIAINDRTGLFASGGADGVVRIGHDLLTAESSAKTLSFKSGVMSMAFSDDGSVLVVGLIGGGLVSVDPVTATVTTTFVGHTDTIGEIAFSPTKREFASAGHDGWVGIWDRDTGVLLKRINGTQGWVTSVTYSDDGTLIALSDNNNLIVTEIASERTILSTDLGYGGPCDGIRLWDRWIITGLRIDGTVMVWDRQRNMEHARLGRQRAGIVAFDVSKDRSVIIAVIEDGEIVVWPLADVLK